MKTPEPDNRRAARLRALAVPVCAVAVLCLLAGCQQTISGAYLASAPNAVCWLQLVQTPDNHVTGQLEASVMKADGSIESGSITVTGAADGENVSLTGSRFLGLESVMLSGTLQGGVLALTGSQSLTSQSIPATFVRSSVNEYQAHISELNARAQAVVRANAFARAKAEAQREAAQSQEDAQRELLRARMQVENAVENLVTAIDETAGKMQKFDSEADVHLGRFPNAEKTYQGITAKMAQYVDRERQLAGNPNASVARSQIAAAVNQASFLTDQVHNQVASLRWSLQNNVEPIANELHFLEQQCAQSPTLDETLAGTLSAACSRLSDAATPFREKFDATVSGLTHLEQVYQTEHGKQQQLLDEAQRLQ